MADPKDTKPATTKPAESKPAAKPSSQPPSAREVLLAMNDLAEEAKKKEKPKLSARQLAKIGMQRLAVAQRRARAGGKSADQTTANAVRLNAKDLGMTIPEYCAAIKIPVPSKLGGLVGTRQEISTEG